MISKDLASTGGGTQNLSGPRVHVRGSIQLPPNLERKDLSWTLVCPLGELTSFVVTAVGVQSLLLVIGNPAEL